MSAARASANVARIMRVRGGLMVKRAPAREPACYGHSGPLPPGGSAEATAASVGAHHARRLALVLVLVAMAVSPLVAFAADAVPTDRDPVADARAVKLTEKLRCLVCQNQTIADSNAALAQDLRHQVHEQIAAGKSDAEIVDYMVARYGDFVLYEPPVKPTTMLLWAGPALLLLIGFVGLFRIVRARRAEPDAPPLTAEEHQRAARLLGGDSAKDIS
jgi:cytochrome c-type biogenesis protein CcmH